MVTVFNEWIETFNLSPPDLPSGGDVAHLSNNVSQKRESSSAVLKNSVMDSFFKCCSIA